MHIASMYILRVKAKHAHWLDISEGFGQVPSKWTHFFLSPFFLPALSRGSTASIPRINLARRARSWTM